VLSIKRLSHRDALALIEGATAEAGIDNLPR